MHLPFETDVKLLTNRHRVRYGTEVHESGVKILDVALIKVYGISAALARCLISFRSCTLHPWKI